MVNKRGISAIVATVLIILITVAAVTIIWTAIIPMIQNSFGIIDADVRINVISSGGYTAYDPSTNMLTVQVGRGSDSSQVEEVRIIIQFENGDTMSSLEAAPNPNQFLTYQYRLSSSEVPVSVSVSPLVVSDSNVGEGTATKDVDFDDGSIPFNPNAEVFGGKEFPTSGLVSWWKFNGDFNDSQGSNHGTESGGANIVGDFLNLDGVDDYMSIVPTNDLILNTGGTISTWINLADLSSTYDNTVFYKGTGAGWANLQIQLFENSGIDQMCFSVSDGTNYLAGGCPKSEILTKEQWYHIVATWNSTTKCVYTNGAESECVQSTIMPANTIASTGIRIGVTAGSSYNFNGTIDDVMIYDRALSLGEINVIYDSQKGGKI